MQRLDPKAVWMFFINSVTVLPLFVVMSFILVFFNLLRILENPMSILPNIILPIVILFTIGLVFQFFWARLTYANYSYELKPEGFRKEHGVIWKKYTTIPYERIQNVDIYRGLVARLLGLSDLHIQTAGMSTTVGSYGGASEGRLPGLNPQVAEQIRDQLIARARGKSQGL